MDELSSAVNQNATAGGLSVNYSRRTIHRDLPGLLYNRTWRYANYEFLTVVPLSTLLDYGRWSDVILRWRKTVVIELVWLDYCTENHWPRGLPEFRRIINHDARIFTATKPVHSADVNCEITNLQSEIRKDYHLRLKMVYYNYETEDETGEWTTTFDVWSY